MILRARPIYFEAQKPIVLLNTNDAEDLGVKGSDRVELKLGRKDKVAIVNTTDSFVLEGEIGLYGPVQDFFNVKPGTGIQVKTCDPPESIKYIKKRMKGKYLTAQEIREIIDDAVDNKLSEVELTAFVISLEHKKLSLSEAASLASAMAHSGKTIKFSNRKVFDKHSVTWDTPVKIKENGKRKLVKIGEFIDKLMEKNKLKIQRIGNDAGYLDIKNSNFEVLSFDKKLKVSFKPLTGIYRHPAPKKLYKIVLKGNREVTVTHCHSVFVLKEGKIKSIPTKDLKPGDFIAVPREVPQVEKYPKSINLVKEFLKMPSRFTEDIFITNISKKFKGIIPYSKREYDLISFNFYRKNKVKLPKEAKIRLKHGKNIPIKIDISEDFIKILGYWIAEGFIDSNGVHFSLGKHENNIIEDIRNCVEKVFGLKSTITHPHRTAVHINVYNQLLGRIFTNILNLKKGARNKEIPDLIYNLPRKLQKAFLLSYFKGDGYFRRKCEIIAVTASDELSIGIQYLLSLCGLSYSLAKKSEEVRIFPSGYKSITAQSHYIYTQANPFLDINTNRTAAFLNFIPIKEADFLKFGRSNFWNWKERREFRNNKYITFNRARTLMNKIPNCDEAQSKKTIFGNLGFLQVKSIAGIENQKEKYVYDFCVEGYENFVGGKGPIFLHNSIGGICGDKTSMIVVPIIAVYGLTIPKTSSRAITSPAGTADKMECICPVELDIDRIKKVVNKTNGCIVWGGALNLSPADNIFVNIEYPFSIDPLLLPSILSKKKAVNSTYIVIDMPTGSQVKVKNTREAEELSKSFIGIGKKLGMKVNCVSTYGEQPLGHGVGPALEARELIDILKGKIKPSDVIDKATEIAGVLLEMAGKKKGQEKATHILKTGKAWDKMQQIIKLQGGDPKIKAEDIPVGDYSFDIKSEKSGKVWWIKNASIVQIARGAGAPKDKGSGVYINKKMGDKVKRGETLMTVYCEKKRKKRHTLQLIKELETIGVSRRFEMLLEKMPDHENGKRYFILER